jgi:hypothetical protein
MDQRQREPSFDESVAQVMRTLPSPIRNYLGQGKYSEVANNLMTKYGLHVDQGGILEREIMLLLMGIENPDEFTQALVEEAKLDQQTINNIVKDVNEQIFVPLREEMRKGPQTVPQIPKPVAVAEPPRTSVLSPRTTIIPANPQLPQRPAQVLAPVPRYVPPKKYFNLQNKIPPASPKATQDTAKLLEDHEEPSPSLKATEGAAHLDISNKVQGVSSPTTETPLRQALRTILPENLPGAMPPPIPPPPPKPEPVVPSVPIAPYSADPYREPVE